MTPKRIKELFAKIEEAEAQASVDLETVQPQLRQGAHILKNEALQRLNSHKAEYSAHTRDNTIAIFVLGDRSKALEFAAIAEDEGDTITIHADEIYRRVAEKVWPNIARGAQLSSAHFTFLVNELMEVGTKLKLYSIRAPTVQSDRFVNDLEQLVDVLRDAARSSNGDGINLLYLQTRVAEKAFEVRHPGKVIPIVVVGVTEPELQSLRNNTFVKGSVVVNVDEVGASKDAVLKAFAALKKEVKGSSGNKNENPADSETDEVETDE